MDVRVLVDWDRDYSFDTTGDNIAADVIGLDWSIGMRPYQNMADEASLTITVRNDTGKYNPENADSPYYGQLIPQTPVKVVMVQDGVETVMYRGWIDKVRPPSWKPQGAYTGKATMQLICKGAKQRLQETEVSLEIQENKRGDEIIALILQQVVLPPALSAGWILGVTGFSELGITTALASTSDYSDLQTGSRTFAFYGDVKAKSDVRVADAYKMIREITDAERGRFFFNREGKAIWWNRDYLIDYAEPTEEVDTSGTYPPQAMDYEYGERITNMVNITVYQRNEPGTITLWSLDAALTIAAGETLTFEAVFVDAEGNQIGAKEGTIAQSGVTWGAGTATITLEEKSDRAQVTIVNASASVDAVLTALNITGEALKTNNKIIVKRENDDSIVTYGRRNELRLNLTALDSVKEAENIADLELRRLKDARGEIAYIGWTNPNDGVTNAHQMDWGIGTRLTVTAGEYSHSQDYVILGEKHSISEGMRVHETQFYLEPLILKRLAAYDKDNQNASVGLKKSSDSPVKTILAQTFKSDYSQSVSQVRLLLKKVGTPTGTLTAKLYSCLDPAEGWELGVSTLGVDTILGSDFAEPLTALGTADTVDIAEVGAWYQWINFEFATPISLTANEPYAIQLEGSYSASASDYVAWGADSSSPSYADGELLYYNALWTQEGKDGSFEVYV